jgi:IclR family transcriptional regulator, KDG regulon repressor
LEPTFIVKSVYTLRVEEVKRARRQRLALAGLNIGMPRSLTFPGSRSNLKRLFAQSLMVPDFTGGEMIRREKSNYAIQSVSHALDVLEQFNHSVEEIGVTDLSKRLKLHKNNVFRLLATLEARGYIEQNRATENYRLGLKCLQLGQIYVNQTGFLAEAKETLEELVKSVDESCYVSVKKGAAIVPLDFIESQNPVRVVSFIGRMLPLHCTAPGKVHLAFDGAQGAAETLPEKLPRFTERTIVDRDALLRQLREVAGIGYAVEQGEFMPEVASIAVPIRDSSRTVIGSLTLAGPTHRLTPQRIEKEIVPLITESGGRLSTRLGFRP